MKQISRQFNILRNEYDCDNFSSLYVGGGTPSLIPGESLSLWAHLINVTQGERTIEVNPESLTVDSLQAYSDLGFNRISMGIQSFQDHILNQMGRLADLKTNMKALDLLENYWKHDYSVDLIFGYPGQTKVSQREDIHTLMKIHPPHFSLYNLTIEKGTSLDKSIESKEIFLPDQEKMDDCWFDSLELIKENHYERYEISSFGLPGHRSKHNLNYWNMGKWLGLGPGGGSFMHDKSDNPFRFIGKSLEEFLNSQDRHLISRGSFYHAENIDRVESLKEIIMMGLRMASGLSLSVLDMAADTEFIPIIQKVFIKWKDRLIQDKKRIYLTEEGLDWHSAVMVDIFFQLENYYGCHE